MAPVHVIPGRGDVHVFSYCRCTAGTVLPRGTLKQSEGENLISLGTMMCEGGNSLLTKQIKNIRALKTNINFKTDLVTSMESC